MSALAPMHPSMEEEKAAIIHQRLISVLTYLLHKKVKLSGNNSIDISDTVLVDGIMKISPHEAILSRR